MRSTIPVSGIGFRPSGLALGPSLPPAVRATRDPDDIIMIK
jgi:hypothetical protein